MKNELAISAVQRLPATSMSDIDLIGKMLAQSEMFGARNPAEGFVIASMCQQEGISYRRWMETYHFIKGRVSKRADAISTDFIRSGGTIKITQRDADGAKVELTRNGSSYTSSITWRDCVNEPFVYAGKESDVVAALAAGGNATKSLKIKDKYATPRSRMQMMWARAISDGVRTLAPDCCQGMYTPEEMDDITPDTAAPVVQPPAAPRDPKPVEVIKPPAKPDAKPAVPAAPPIVPAASAVPAADPVPPAPVAQPAEPAQLPAPPAGGGSQTPFDEMAKDNASEGEDFTACPVKGGMFGKRWDAMETNHLRLALTLDNVEIKLGHRCEINRIIAEREQTQQESK